MESLATFIPTVSELWTSGQAAFWFVIVLSILVFVHEMGHYLAARSVGIKVTAFSIGFGPEIFGWTAKNGERWKISWFPLGGYVSMYGFDESELKKASKKDRDASYAGKPVWARMWAVFAGPFANFIFAWVVLMALFTGGQQQIQPIIGEVLANMPAAEAGIQAGDKILSVNGEAITDWEMLRDRVGNSRGQANIVILRDNTEQNITILPQIKDETDAVGTTRTVGRIGVTPSMQVETVPVPLLQVPVVAAEQTWELTAQTFRALANLATGKLDHSNLGGPIQIADVVNQSTQYGLYAVLSLMALISVNLGLLNLIPLPVLDGGHLLFLSIEALIRRPVPMKIQQLAYNGGIAVLVLIMGLAFTNDIGRILAALGAS